MEKIRLGKTDLMVTKASFGALPIQRISREDAVKLGAGLSRLLGLVNLSKHQLNE